ncbi:MAG: UbiA prenyltransferase family protein [Bacteroidales bacterium]|jgi:4-hydroxybenzoate polyprenyltransferase|nr:UbiA prenyltransferase family protein [Bacteroidales bacterium]
MSVKSAIQLLRPLQWAKNVFIFLPLFFNASFGHLHLLFSCVIAFIAFSLAASSVYCFNDILDLDADKLHPEKCKRPIASGKVSKKQAYILMTATFTLSMLVILVGGFEHKLSTAGLIVVYYLLNIAYSLGLKQIAILDVMLVAFFFVVRVIVGGVATGIHLSEWIVLMTFLLALFLAFAKRRDDVVIFQNTGVTMRKNIGNYNLEFINQVLTLIAGTTIIAYIIYCVSPEVTERFRCKYVYLTAIFVLAGMIRYLQITIVDLKSGSPTKTLLKDRFIQICILGWMATFTFIIYL